MANYQIEIERNGVTPAQFLRYIRQQCEKKGLDFGIDRETFEKPLSEGSYSYTVINGEKQCHSEEYRTVTHTRRKVASYQIQGASPATTIPTSWKNIRKQSYTIMTGQPTEPTLLARRKSARPSPTTARPIFSILTAPCITRFADLPLTTKKSATAIITKQTAMRNNDSPRFGGGLFRPPREIKDMFGRFASLLFCRWCVSCDSQKAKHNL